MLKCQTETYKSLHLRVGELIEIRSADEILRTLDANGTVDALPFMPEMLKYCGKRFTVFKRVDKVCDTIDKTGFRRMRDVVLLKGLRCDGEAHGGCQAECMILWKEAWLKRVLPSARQKPSVAAGVKAENSERSASRTGCTNECNEATLLKSTRKYTALEHIEEETFVCQATALKNATTALLWWDLTPYFRDLWSGNVSPLQGIRGILIILFNAVQRIRNGAVYPHLEQGNLAKTPSEILNLQPGEIVEIKSKNEILQTLDHNNKNRGLWFDVEMLKFCGRRFSVRGHVRKIINERTGRMLNFSNSCIILNGVTCNGDCHQFCPRSEYIYWREIWLRRSV